MLLKWEIETYFLSHLEKGKKTNTCLTRMCGEDGCSSFCCTCVHRRTEMAYEQHCAPDRLALETTVCPPQNCFWTRQLTIIHTFLHLKTSLLYLKGKKKKHQNNDPPNPFNNNNKKKNQQKKKDKKNTKPTDKTNTKPCYNSVVLKILSYYSLCSIVSVPVMLSVLLYPGQRFAPLLV